MNLFIKLSVVLIILVDLAALADIIKGVEPELTNEYNTLIFSAVVFMVLLFRYRWRNLNRANND